MKVLSDLTDNQRKALGIIDRHACVFKRRTGWSARGSEIIQRQTLDPLVGFGLVRITEFKRDGFTLTKATLTDTGEVLAAKMCRWLARKKAA